MEISTERHAEILEQDRSGQVSIVVNTTGFRELFCKSDPDKLSQIVGFSVHRGMRLVRFFWNAECVLLPIVLIASPFVFQWWALAIAPALFVIWMFNKALASWGQQRMYPVILLIVIAAAVVVLVPGLSTSARAFVVACGALLLTSRVLYLYTAAFAFALLRASGEFFAEFCDDREDVLLPLITLRRNW